MGWPHKWDRTQCHGVLQTVHWDQSHVKKMYISVCLTVTPNIALINFSIIAGKCRSIRLSKLWHRTHGRMADAGLRAASQKFTIGCRLLNAYFMNRSLSRLCRQCLFAGKIANVRVRKPKVRSIPKCVGYSAPLN